MNLKNTGMLISKKRKEKNLTQKELAEKLFVSEKTISKWEQGRGFPSPDYLMPLSENLDVTPQELLLGSEIPKENLENASNKLAVDQYKTIRKKERKSLILGIIGCLGLCLLETLLALGHCDETIANYIFIVVILLLLLGEYTTK